MRGEMHQTPHQQTPARHSSPHGATAPAILPPAPMVCVYIESEIHFLSLSKRFIWLQPFILCYCFESINILEFNIKFLDERCAETRGARLSIFSSWNGPARVPTKIAFSWFSSISCTILCPRSPCNNNSKGICKNLNLSFSIKLFYSENWKMECNACQDCMGNL